MGIFEHGTRLEDHDARALERGRIRHFQPRDFAVLVGDQVRPVEGRRREPPAVTRGIRKVVGVARCIDQQLLRHTTADNAGAADAVLLGYRNARAIAGCDPRGTNTARASTDNEEIDLPIRHAFPFCASANAARIRSYRSCPFFFISARILPMISSAILSDHTFTKSKVCCRILGSVAEIFWPTADL